MATEQIDIKVHVHITKKVGYDTVCLATATVEDMGEWPVGAKLATALDDVMDRISAQVRAETRRRVEAETEAESNG